MCCDDFKVYRVIYMICFGRDQVSLLKTDFIQYKIDRKRDLEKINVWQRMITLVH